MSEMEEFNEKLKEEYFDKIEVIQIVDWMGKILFTYLPDEFDEAIAKFFELDDEDTYFQALDSEGRDMGIQY